MRKVKGEGKVNLESLGLVWPLYPLFLYLSRLREKGWWAVDGVFQEVRGEEGEGEKEGKAKSLKDRRDFCNVF